MNPEETYEEALHREIEEELGVKVEIKRFAGTLPMSYPYDGVALPILCMYSVAKIIAGKITPRDDVEEVAFLADKKTNEITLTFPPQSTLVPSHA
jgi:NADH pyrophosphatase NudC (nudix superfamily)